MDPSFISPPRLPQHIALVDAPQSQDGLLLRYLLDDFKDALAAYARISRTHTPTFAFKIDDNADTVVIACAEPLEIRSCCNVLDALSPQTRIYVIACTASPNPANLLNDLQKLDDSCTQRSLRWCGALAVGSSDVLERSIEQPRMSAWRRWASEAMDRFIGAVRCGDTVANTARAARSPFDDEIRYNVVFARCTLPTFMQRFATR